MRFAHFFIDRPIFASVLSVAMLVIGGVAFFNLPVAQYPEVTPPTIVVEANYPGASADVVGRTVATPIEEEVNGVEGMLYMSSQSTSDGRMQLTVTFNIGTDVDAAQVLVQNRVAIAEPRLPEAVRRLGVTTKKSSPDLMMVIHLVSPDGRYDQTYISNYASLNIRDELARLDGVGDASVFGGRDYSMRVWLDPNRVAAFDMTAGDIVQALQEHNVQVAAGVVGQPPVPTAGAFQLTVNALGRLEDPGQFEEIVVKTSDQGRVVRLRDVARVELGARSYGVNGYLDGKPALPILIFQRPGSNALETDEEIQAKMAELSQRFPDGLEYKIIYNPTNFVRASLKALNTTILEAVALVVFVVILFLQKWRVALIPLLAIPVSLIGTFAVMSIFGFSLNNLSLFGLVLAIGIVVDDAIVVVENVERNLSLGLNPREAARKAMDEVGGALIAISLVLAAVFIPVAFITGLSGQFYQQFALTIAVATLISMFNSLTLSPALSALLLKHQEPQQGVLGRLFDHTLGRFFRGFNWAFERTSHGYADAVCAVTRKAGIALVLYVGLVALTGYGFQQVPTGLIPDQDQGYLIVDVQLPDGASVARTDAVVQEVMRTVLETPGFEHAVGFAGFSGATRSNNSKSGAVFAVLDPFEQRLDGPSAFAAAGTLQQRLAPNLPMWTECAPRCSTCPWTEYSKRCKSIWVEPMSTTLIYLVVLTRSGCRPMGRTATKSMTLRSYAPEATPAPWYRWGPSQRLRRSLRRIGSCVTTSTQRRISMLRRSRDSARDRPLPASKKRVISSYPQDSGFHGPTSPTKRSSPATRHPSPSRWRCCLSFWCWQRNTRA